MEAVNTKFLGKNIRIIVLISYSIFRPRTSWVASNIRFEIEILLPVCQLLGWFQKESRADRVPRQEEGSFDRFNRYLGWSKCIRLLAHRRKSERINENDWGQHF